MGRKRAYKPSKLVLQRRAERYAGMTRSEWAGYQKRMVIVDIEDVCSEFGIKPEDIRRTGWERGNCSVAARKRPMRLAVARELYKLGYCITTIALGMGVDHSTVRNWLEKEIV